MPGPDNTGVPAGTVLTVHDGDLRITKAGTVIDAMDIRGYVSIEADNVTIKRSFIHGGAPKQGRALISNWQGNINLRVEDSTLDAAQPSVMVDGLSGGSLTALRLDVSDVVDPIKVIGSNVTVRSSWLHGTTHSTQDTFQSDGKTHDDNIQIEGGTNILIEGNRLEDAHNAAIMVTQNHSATNRLVIRSNYMEDGGCTVNVTEGGGGAIVGSIISGNSFGLGHYGTTCPMRIPSSSPFDISGNTWAATGKPADPQRF